MKAVRVNVTAENIALGKRMSCQSCPIARALLDAGAKDVHVGFSATKAVVDESDALRLARLPPAAQEFVAAFDDGAEVAPLSFDLEFRP